MEGLAAKLRERIRRLTHIKNEYIISVKEIEKEIEEAEKALQQLEGLSAGYTLQ